VKAFSRMEHPARGFYRAQFYTSVAWWLLVRRISGKFLFDVAASSVFTRPGWLPRRWLRRLHGARKLVFVASLAGLGAGGLLSGSLPPLLVRAGVAALFSLYHLLENSTTNRHGEFPVLYAVWGLCIPDPRYASAFCLGNTIHFILSSGVCKLLVGGRQWLHASTMQTYLRAYSESKSAPPASMTLNRCAAAAPWVASGISVSTVVLEVCLIPMTLFLPPSHRFLAVTGLVAMHVGIATLMSARVGLVFLTTLPIYIVGFSCEAPVFSPEWWCAAAIGIGPSAWSVARQRMLPDDWPCSAVSLFMWSGQQADAIIKTMMTGDRRIVLATSEAAAGARNGEAKPGDSIIGLPVLYHGGVSKGTPVGISIDIQMQPALCGCSTCEKYILRGTQGTPAP